MPDEGLWLFLKVSEIDPRKSPRKNTLILVPKKQVPLATRRNRLRRLIREVVRKDPFFLKEGVFFEFKIQAHPPKEPDFACVQSLVEKLKMKLLPC